MTLKRMSITSLGGCYGNIYGVCECECEGGTGATGGITAVVNNGGGAEVGQNITGSDLNLRTITGSNGIIATQNTDTVNISSSQSLSNLPGGAGILVTGLPNATFRSILAGTGISIASNSNTFTFANTGVANVVNLGSGRQIASLPIVSATLNLRTLTGSGGVTLTQSANAIDISTPPYTLAAAPATGLTLISTGFPFATLKVLDSGPGISLSATTNAITINNTMTPTNTVTNLGTGSAVLVDVLAGSVRGRTLVSQGDALVNTSGNNITIGARQPVNIGLGEGIFAGSSGLTNQFKSLVPFGNIQVFSDSSNIFFRPLITNIIPYSGKTILNTYLSGNPELSSFLGFGSEVSVTSSDAFPATYPVLPTAFIGWVAPYGGEIKRVSNLIKFSIPTTVTEQLDIYCAIHRCKEGDVSMNLIWSDLVFSTNSNISAGDFVQTTFNMAVGIDAGWHLYMSFFAHRPSAAGSTDLIEFYTSSSVTLVSTETL